MKILIPTDFSPEAENAVKYAQMIAQSNSVEMILFHSIHPDCITFLYEILIPTEMTWKEEAKKRLNDRKFTIEYNSDVLVRTVISEDQLETSLKKIVSEEKIDYVVMGTKGTAGSWIRKLSGSVTGDIISSVKIPVIVVPATYKVLPMKRVVFATDYHHGDFEVLQTVTNFVRPLNAHIHVIHLTEKISREQRDRMREFIDTINGYLKYNNISYEVIEAADMEFRAREYLESLNADLTVVSKTRHYIWEWFNHISISKELTEHSSKPILIFHHASQPKIITL